MQKQKYFLPLALLVLAIGFVYSPILKFPMPAWREPIEVIGHIVAAAVFFLILNVNFSIPAAFCGASLFAFLPVYASQWAAGPLGLAGIGLYVGGVLLASLAAFGFERFYIFLKTQEALIRQLFLAGVGVLILGLALMAVDTNRVWRDEMSLRRWRAEHRPSAVSLNAWARFLYTHTAGADKAKSVYEQALKKDPHNKEANFALADIYEDQADAQGMINVYKRLLEMYPEDLDVMTLIIQGYTDAIKKYPDVSIYQEKREDVLAEYEQLTKRKKYGANDYFNLGFLYEQVGGYEEAMRFYAKAIALDPKHEKATYNLASRYQASGDIKTALVLYERLVHFHPRSTLAYLNMGVIYNALGDADKARYLYQKVINIDPDNAEAYFNLGYLSETAGELKDALNYYEKAVDHDSRQAEAYYNMGNVYALLEQYPEAIASYLKTVAINPNHQNAFVNLSILSFKARDFQGSIRYLEEARLLGYNPPAAYLKTLEPYRKK